MSRDALQSSEIARPRPPYSPVVVSGDLVFTAGKVAFDEDGQLIPGGIEEQTGRALDNLEACLRAAACTLDDVVKVSAFPADLADFETFNGINASRFEKPFPARSTVGLDLPGGILVEVEAIARKATADDGSATR